MPTLVLIRHGQSAWNLENRFTGWWDVPLTDQRHRRGDRRRASCSASAATTSTACSPASRARAIKTANLMLEAMDRLWLPVVKDWRLNERHYGGLTGLNKAETAAEYGEEQVHVWRRSFDVPPPPMVPGGPFDLSADRRYAGVDVPATESLKDTIRRVLPYWEATISPCLRDGERVVVAAHGNSLRALVKHLSGIGDADIASLEIPTGQPIVYELDDALTATKRFYLHES